MYRNIIESRVQDYCKNNLVNDNDIGFMKYINEVFYRRADNEVDDSIIEASIVDGQSDKQIDLIQIEDDEVITIRIIQVKNTTGFSSNTIILLNNGLDWIFNQPLDKVEGLKNISFRDRILEIRDIINNKNKSIDNIYIDVAYVTLGDKNDISEEDEIKDEIEKLIKKYSSLFVNFRFELYGAKDIYDYINLKNKKNIDIEFSIIYDSNVPSIIQNSYDHIRSLVCNIKAKELIKLFKSQQSEYLFEQNVRKYLDDKSKVNKNIILAAEGEDSQYFWALNNGVTIICDKYDCVPIGGKATVNIKNLQIINGCQTSMALYAAEKEGKLKEDTSLLLRIHETNNSNIIEKIIIATNNQNPINPRDLVSNSSRQVELQQYFAEIYGIRYQRKRNDFIDIDGKMINRRDIVSNDKVGQAALACIKCKPSIALGSKGKIFTDEKSVFDLDNEKIALSYFIYEKVLQFAKKDQIKTDSEKVSILKFGRFHISNLIYKKYVNKVSIDFNKSIYHNDFDISKDILQSFQKINGIIEEESKHNLLSYFKNTQKSKNILNIKLK